MSERVEIAAYTYVHEAELAATTLRAAGIDVSLVNQHTIGVDSFMSNAMGGVRVSVPADQVEQARALLDTPDETRIVFREHFHTGVTRALVGVVVFVFLSSWLLLLLPWLPRWAIGVGGLLLIVGLYKTAQSQIRCSGPSCHAQLNDEEQCPKCTGLVVDDLRPGENQLSAEERWLAEQGHG